MPFVTHVWRARKRIKKDNQLLTQLYSDSPWDPIFLARDTNQTPLELHDQVERLIREGYIERITNPLHSGRTLLLTAIGKNRADSIRPRS